MVEVKPIEDKTIIKQKRWDDVARVVEGWADGAGYGIDSGIKETVIAFNALDFKTSASCEGHIDGVGGPWIEVEASDEKAADLATQATKLADEARESGRPQEEIDALDEKKHALELESKRPILEMGVRLMEILNDFYANRQVPYDRRLIMQDGWFQFRLQSAGTHLQKIADEETRQKKLEEYQEEVRDFTAFLKSRYFAG